MKDKQSLNAFSFIRGSGINFGTRGVVCQQIIEQQKNTSCECTILYEFIKLSQTKLWKI